MACVPLLVLSAGAGRCYATRSKPPACAHCTQSREEFATRVSWCPAPAMATPPLWWTSCSQVTVTFLINVKCIALQFNAWLYSVFWYSVCKSCEQGCKFKEDFNFLLWVFVVWHADCTDGSKKGPYVNWWNMHLVDSMHCYCLKVIWGNSGSAFMLSCCLDLSQKCKS